MARQKDRLHRVLVIGANPAGIAATNKLGELGIPVTLVDRDYDLDQKLACEDYRLPSGVLMNFAHRSGLLRILRNPDIRLILPGEVESLKNTQEGFSALVRQRPSFVDASRCTLCGKCLEACPVETCSNEKPISFAGRRSLPGRPFIQKAKTPPCQSECPLGVNAQGYVALARAGKYAESLALIRRDNVLPGICGRICAHPCEAACRRSDLDEPVSIRAIKRFVSDAETGSVNEPAPEPREETVAVVGSGPAGLAAAADLARLGYPVTVYEKEEEAGGLLRYAIGPYRLPREILERDLAYIKELGVAIKTGVSLDLKKDLPRLAEENNAVIVATGAWKDRRIGAPGEDSEKVSGCIDLLTRIYRGEVTDLKNQKVAIIGDGNSAFDLARAVKRLGAEVTILSWFPAEMLPADQDEIQGATEEGVEIVCRFRVGEFAEKDGRLALTCLPTQPGPPDANGIPWPVAVKGAPVKEMIFDLAVVAIGQIGPFGADGDNACFAVTEYGYADANEDFCTSLPGVFAAGDAVSGPTNVVRAMAAGRAAANAAHREISGEALVRPTFRPEAEYPEIDRTLPSSPRQSEPERQPQVRVADFDEVALGLSEDQILAEAGRCLNCGICSECLACRDACGEVGAVVHDEAEVLLKEHAGVVIIADPEAAPSVHGEDVIRAYGPPAAKSDVQAMITRGLSAASRALTYLSGTASRPRGWGLSYKPPDPGLSGDVRIGVFVCRCNDSLGWDPEFSAIVEGLRTLPDVVHVEEVLSACIPEGTDAIVRTVRRKGISRLVLASCVCCPLDFICSACTDQRSRLKDALFRNTGLSRSMAETCNLRGEALSLLKRDPALAREQFSGLLQRSIFRARGLRALPTPVRNYNFTAAVVGNSEAAMESALALAESGTDVFLLGGLEKPLEQAPEHENLQVFLGSSVQSISGTLGEFHLMVKTGEGVRPVTVGTVVLGAESEKRIPYAHQKGLASKGITAGTQKPGVTGLPFLLPGSTSVPGMFLASPSGIGVSERKKGEAAAVQAAAVLPRGPRQLKGYTVVVDKLRCRGCGACVKVCPYQAVSLTENEAGGWSAVVDEALCKGCGNCISVCPPNAADSPYRNQAFLEQMLEELLLEPLEN